MTMTTKGTASVTLPADDQILITREFNATPDLVYRAYTTPELVQKWWGGGCREVHTCEIDLRVGGRWRYVLRTEEGFEVGFHGEYHEVVTDERLVNTEIFENTPEGDSPPALITTTFAALPGGRTLLTQLMQLESQEIRDIILATGMESGMQDGYDVMEELAVRLA